MPSTNDRPCEHDPFSHAATVEEAADYYETIMRRAYLGFQSEIGNMVRTVAEGGSVCVICLSGLEAGRGAAELPCTHVFHRTCVGAWLWENHSCPTCRADVWGGGGGEVVGVEDGGGSGHEPVDI